MGQIMLCNKRNKYTVLTMAAILLSNIFIFSPYLLYITNIEQFTSSLFSVMKLCLMPALFIFLLFIPLSKFHYRGDLHRIATILAILSILVWFQGNVLLWDYGILDGRNIIWDEHIWRGWIDGSIWIATIILVTSFYKNIGSFIIKSAIFIFILQFFSISYISYENWELIQKKNSKALAGELTEILKFSEKNNVLHLLVDGFQSDVFNELLHHESLGDRYQKSFQGFVYYRETVGVFPYTRFAIPAFLAGEMYSNELPKDTYIDNILKGDTILSVANNEGYEIDIASGDEYLINRYSNLPYRNIYNMEDLGNAGAQFKDAATTIDLALFRILPHFLKIYIYNNQKWFISQLVVSKDFFQFSYFLHTHFLNIFSHSMSVERKSPVYKYIHVMNTHNPMVVDNNCAYSGVATRMNRATLTMQSKCTLDTLSVLLNRMKDLDIYDSTLIIIHADHGGWVPNYRQGPPPTLFSTNIEAPQWVASLASPLLAIKKPYDMADFRVSDKQASLLDIPATISDIMGWDSSFNWQALEKMDLEISRKRIFRFYEWQRDAWETDYTGPIQELSIEGSHYEVEWKPEKIFYPPK